MILAIRYQKCSIDDAEVALLHATRTATDPARLAQQFIGEFLTRPDGARREVEILGKSERFNMAVSGPRGLAIWTRDAVEICVENSLLRDLEFIEELKRRNGFSTARILRRDVRPFVRPAVVELRRILCGGKAVRP